MAFVPAVNTAEVALAFSQADGSFAENTFYVKAPGAWTTTELTTMANAFVTWFSTGDGTHDYQKSMGDDNSLVAVSARDLTTQHGFVVTTNTGLPLAGLNGGNSSSMGTTWTVTHRTGLAGRSFRGRTFLVGLPGSAVSPEDLNTIVGAYATSVIEAFTPLIAAVPAALSGAELVVLSRYSGVDSGGKPIPRSTGIMTPITQFGYHNLLMDFQRRRAPGHNRHH